jgi:hypothetical protein
MLLFIEKNCPFCEDIKNINIPNLNKFYVENGEVIIEENRIPLNKNIKGLPALYVEEENTIYIGKYVKEYLNRRV